ncbi:hypothetical protein KY284_000742 [Solanum tuberosum]|nr:hypothetical protein KY284_000742 [Solanum tuberosum]
MLEFWDHLQRDLKRISPNVLSRLVQLEELHMVEVKFFSYSTFRKLESLSGLSSLTLSEYFEDVIYSNLGLSSRLTRYALKVGRADRYLNTSLMDKMMDLENVLTELLLGGFHNVKDLCLASSDSLTHLLKIHGHNNIPDNVEGIDFPLLRKMHFNGLQEFQNFWLTANNSTFILNPLFHGKVCCPNLEELAISWADSISALCSYQLPAAYFRKVRKLKVHTSEKLRNLISPSVARGLNNFRRLDLYGCLSMEEVITEEEQEIMTNEPLFPLLDN